MPYIPKNRILTNLKTTPNEFVYKANNKPYDGIYWKDYKGKYYTGENPNVKPTYEIIKVIPYEEYTDPIIYKSIKFLQKKIDELVEEVNTLKNS